MRNAPPHPIFPNMVASRFLILLSFIVLAGFTADGLAIPMSAEGDRQHVIQLSPTGEGRAYAVTYSPNGRSLAVGTSLGIFFFNSSDLQLIRFTPTDSWVRALEFFPDGSLLASGSYDPIVRFWRTSDGTLARELSGHTSWVWAMDLTPNGELLAIASDDNSVRLWSVPDGETLGVIGQGTEGIRAVAFSPEGTLLATGGYDKVIRLWRVDDGTLVRELKGHTDWVRVLTFSPNGELLASGAFDGTVRLWRISDGELLVTREEHSSSVLGLAFSPDGELLASASVDTTLRLWKMPKAEPYALLKGHTDFVFDVAFAPDGKTLASGGGDNTVRVWDVPREINQGTQEIVSSPSNCTACHHPRGTVKPARVVETGCAVCHEDGALVLNWCPALPSSLDETMVHVSPRSHAEGVGLPLSVPTLSVVIATPGNGEHLYTSNDIITSIPIAGYINSTMIPFSGIDLNLEVWSGAQQVALLSAKPHANGTFFFSVNIRPSGAAPFPDLDGQKFYCLRCHTEALTVLPPNEVRLVVTAKASDGTQASDERLVYVDCSGNASIPVNVLLEDGQPVPAVSIQASTRLYEWRGRTYTGISDERGQASLSVEALSQIPTTYKISAPPTVVDSVLYESIDPVEVTLPPGASSAPPITLRVRATHGQLSGQLTPPTTDPVDIMAIHLPDGASLHTLSSPRGEFNFPELPIGRYLMVGDPDTLASYGQTAQPQYVDLFEQPHASLDLPLSPLSGTSLSGAVRQKDGRLLPFAFVSLEGVTASQPVLPDSGRFTLVGLPSGVHTLLVSAPGFYSQAHIVDPANLEPIDLDLVIRPETRIIPWGIGKIMVPPETRLVEDGLLLTLESGWLWGHGGETKPLTIKLGQAEITLPEGEFALERLPGQAAWFYLFGGQSTIQWADDPAIIPVDEDQMVALVQDIRPIPVPYNPVVLASIRQVNQEAISLTWQPSLKVQIRDRLARAGIATAQIVTLITYAIVFISIVAGPFIGIYWWRRNQSKANDPFSRSDIDPNG